MCGIAAWFRHPTKVDDKTVNAVMSILFPRLMLESEDRGVDATGIYQLHADGDWMMAKTGRRASEWLALNADPTAEDPIRFDTFLRAWDEHPAQVKAVVGHCRKATAGSLSGSKNEDNHPFAVQLDEKNAILGVHNGTLINHERIFTRLGELGSPLERLGRVDSEVLFHLLYHASDGGTRPWTTKDLHSVARKVEGAYALVAVNSRFPDQVAVMRDDRPIEVCLIQPIGVAVLISQKLFVDRALANYEIIRRHALRHLPALTAETQMIPERSCRIFDLTRKIPTIPRWGGMEEISEKADLNSRSHAFADAEWQPVLPKTTPAVTPPVDAPVTPPAKTDDAPAVKTSKVVVPGPQDDPNKPIAAAAPVATPIVIPDNRTEAESQLIREARYIDLCPTFRTKPELAQILGIAQISLESNGVSTANFDIMNRLLELGFLQGYALGTLDSTKEVERIKQTAKGQAEKLEEASDKWQKSQRAAWEMKALLICYKYLDVCGMPLTEQNLGTVLEGACQKDQSRVAKIMKMHSQITGGKILKALKDYLAEGKKDTAEPKAQTE